MEGEAEEIEYKNETSYSQYLRVLLLYITFTNYYIVQETFRYEVIIVQYVEVNVDEIKYKKVNIAFYILMISTTLYHTYQLLYCTGHVQMRSNDKIMELELEEITYENVNIAFYILRISTTLYLSYQLLYCTGYIKMTSNYSTIEVDSEEIEYKNETSHFQYLRVLLLYITFTNYYIIQDTFRW